MPASPQDPLLTSGTLRSGVPHLPQLVAFLKRFFAEERTRYLLALDPQGNSEDEDLLFALRQVHLLRSPEGSSFFGNLDNEVARGGANFSQGERQLLAVARAVLADRNVVVLGAPSAPRPARELVEAVEADGLGCRLAMADEATSSIDAETERLLDQTLQEVFQGKTLLIVAHRLRYVTRPSLFKKWARPLTSSQYYRWVRPSPRSGSGQGPRVRYIRRLPSSESSSKVSS